MQKPLIVVKLGGSALTDKKRAYTPRIREIDRAAKQVTELTKRCALVIVHGAGSYGHIPVTRWKLQSGFSHRAQLKGLAETKAKLLEWEAVFDEVFLKHQIPLIPLLASDFVLTKNRRIASADLHPIRSWLSLGCIPSIGGDIVTDMKNGFAILSGDQLAAYLAVELKASRLIFATDVEGIFDANPKIDPHAHLISELSTRSALRVVQNARVSTFPDVTGGMAGKISEAVVAASKGVPVFFINLTKDERLSKAILGQEVKGSKILPD
jgi:isopentenyl phosphate kinase